MISYAVPGVVVETGGVTFVAERGDLCQQGVKLEQCVPVRTNVVAHNGVATTRSGLTCSGSRSRPVDEPHASQATSTIRASP